MSGAHSSLSNVLADEKEIPKVATHHRVIHYGARRRIGKTDGLKKKIHLNLKKKETFEFENIYSRFKEARVDSLLNNDHGELWIDGRIAGKEGRFHLGHFMIHHKVELPVSNTIAVNNNLLRILSVIQLNLEKNSFRI